MENYLNNYLITLSFILHAKILIQILIILKKKNKAIYNIKEEIIIKINF